MSAIEQNLALVRRFWDDLYAHEFARLGAYFTENAVYDDVPIPAARVVGPAAIMRKLEIGLGPVPRHVHHVHRMVADETAVVREHPGLVLRGGPRRGASAGLSGGDCRREG